MTSKSYRELDKLSPRTREKVKNFIEEAGTLGVFITETWRSDERQAELFKSKNSFLDGKTQKSMHQLGLAVDIAFSDDKTTLQVERDLYPEDFARWRKVADIAKKHGLDWGYDLWSWDKPHFQDDGSEIKKIDSVSPWAKESVKKATEKGVATVWDNPRVIVGTQTLGYIFKNLGVISNVEPEGITKEQLIVALDRLKLLD